MAVKLHRCSTMWLKGPHPCWHVQKALDEAGMEYEIVKHPGNPLTRGKRDQLQQLTGQRVLPVIELADGTMVRKDSRELAREIREGRLQQGSAGAM